MPGEKAQRQAGEAESGVRAPPQHPGRLLRHLRRERVPGGQPAAEPPPRTAGRKALKARNHPLRAPLQGRGTPRPGGEGPRGGAAAAPGRLTRAAPGPVTCGRCRSGSHGDAGPGRARGLLWGRAPAPGPAPPPPRRPLPAPPPGGGPWAGPGAGPAGGAAARP